jgi:uncharacterized repeat protein (TIGR01451 family)
MNTIRRYVWSKETFVATIVFLLILTFAFSVHHKSAFSSAEVHFTDLSPSGMQIMPASCPSDPGTPDAPFGCSGRTPLCADGSLAPNNDVNECPPDIGPPSPPPPSCNPILDFFGLCSSYSLSVTMSELSPGNGVTVRPGDTISYRMPFRNTGSGPQTNMYIIDEPSANTQITWQGGGTDTNGTNGWQVWWNQGQLSAAGQPLDSGYVDFNVTVKASAPNGAICNTASYHSDQVGWQTTNQVCNPVFNPDQNPTCSTAGQPCHSPANICGQTNTGTYGTDPSCTCSATTPPNSQCQASTCQFAGQTCYSAPNICSETNTGVYGSDPSCPCSATTPPNSQCNPPIIVNIWNVHPTLVRKLDSVTIEWSVSNAAGCTVVGTNGDIWHGLSGTKNSSAITAQTIFSLHCDALPHVVPDSVTKSATVNIAPVYNGL